MQRQAGVVGVFQPVLELNLHRQAPAWAANHIRLLSAGDEGGHTNTERSLSSEEASEGRERDRLSGPGSRDVHMSLQHEVRSAHVVLAAVFEELDLRRRACKTLSGGGTGGEGTRDGVGRALTDFLTVVGQPSSNTGPLSVLLILKRREKLMGRM